MEYVDKVLAIKFHRNGVGGAPFKVVYFTDKEAGRTLIATVFQAEHHIAVIDQLNLENCYRGDYFEGDLKAIIQADERERYGASDFFGQACEWVAPGGVRCTNDATDVSLYHALCAKHAGTKIDEDLATVKEVLTPGWIARDRGSKGNP